MTIRSDDVPDFNEALDSLIESLESSSSTSTIFSGIYLYSIKPGSIIRIDTDSGFVILEILNQVNLRVKIVAGNLPISGITRNIRSLIYYGDKCRQVHGFIGWHNSRFFIDSICFEKIERVFINNKLIYPEPVGKSKAIN